MSIPVTAIWSLNGLERLFPMDEPPASECAASGWSLAAAGGEYIGFQLGIRSAVRPGDIAVVPGPLCSGARSIPPECLRVRWVGIVPVPHDSFDPESAERPDNVPGWYPDPLLEETPWTGALPPRSAAVHLLLRVPAGTPAGTYRGSVSVRCAGDEIASLSLSVEVWPFSIPERPTFHVTNWFQGDCVTKWHRCEPWSARHWRLLELYAREMAAHRQDTISTPTLFGNFHNFDQMTLVDVFRERDGTYTFDFGRLGRWVKLFDRAGFSLFEMWHMAAQGPGRTAPRLFVTDRATGHRACHEAMSVNNPLYRRIVGSFLRSLSQWLERRGLLDRFLLHVFDEPVRERWPHYAELSEFYRRHAPGIRHIDAISTSELITGFGADIDIPVPLTPHLADDEYYRERARAGQKPVWWYTCCGPRGRFANRFVAQPLITTRILHWQAFTHHISGYLHWGYNFWHRTGQDASGWPGVSHYADEALLNPYREHPARWAVGDACIVYPHPHWWEDHGPVASLRYEAMREGLQDYELLRMLDDVSRGGGRAAAGAHGLLAEVRGPIAGSLTDFCRAPNVLLDLRTRIGRCIAQAM